MEYLVPLSPGVKLLGKVDVLPVLFLVPENPALVSPFIYKLPPPEEASPIIIKKKSPEEAEYAVREEVLQPPPVGAVPEVSRSFDVAPELYIPIL
jgi:hypothetical protein